MELYFFARFHAHKGKEVEAEKELLEVLAPSREEPGCLGIHAFRSVRDPRLFYIHSRWKNEEAFESHANMPHTVRFLERIEPLIDHPFDPARTEMIG
jgi:quinol monooxygenase YgiN